MAGSQVLCLENEEPYVKITESNPEFYYCEGQRLALEALLAEGEEAFKNCLSREKLRPFLSDGELQELKSAVNGQDSQATSLGGTGNHSHADSGSSLSYWPGRSDEPPPDLELGWPDNGSWKGITRAEVYTHPPGEGAPHVKELVRRCIQQANKVWKRRNVLGSDCIPGSHWCRSKCENGDHWKFIKRFCEHVRIHIASCKELSATGKFILIIWFDEMKSPNWEFLLKYPPPSKLLLPIRSEFDLSSWPTSLLKDFSSRNELETSKHSMA